MNIKSLGRNPSELLKWMSRNIQYGWVSEDGKAYFGDDGDYYFYQQYYLQSPEELIKSKIGVCYDQVELERAWFMTNNIPHKVYYIEERFTDNVATHTFLAYTEKGYYFWFENAFEIYRDIRRYNNLEALLKDVVTKFKQFSNIPIGYTKLYELNQPMEAGLNNRDYMIKAKSGESIMVA